MSSDGPIQFVRDEGSGDASVLVGMRCVACRGDEPTMTDEEIAAVRDQVPDWEIVEIDGIKRARRVFRFPDFASALRFTDQVGALAEEQGHHPSILTEWGRTTVIVANPPWPAWKSSRRARSTSATPSA